MKPRSLVHISLLTIIVLLSLLSGCLYRQNRVIESKNRELIIQNDSILSINLELIHAIQKENKREGLAEVTGELPKPLK